MTVRRFALVLVAALLLQGSVFAWHYRDLLYFRQPVAAIQQDRAEAFATYATNALSREKLTRHHLDTIAEAAVGLGRSDIEVQALTRRLDLDPHDAQVKLRLADALRRGHRFNEAERLYLDVLRSRNERQ